MAGMTFNLSSLAAVRDIAGGYMRQLGEKYENIAVVNADLSFSSRTREFIERFPERSFNVGIAEQNLVSFAAGLAQEGFIPYVCSMAPFLSMRACEQVRTDVCYGGLPVRLLGTGAGYSAGVSGATHCALEDVAILGSMAGMTVIEPGDPYQAVQMLEASVHWPGPIYIRMGREATHSIYPEDIEYRIGRALTACEGEDGAFIACGITVHHALAAAQRLRDTLGARVRVVDMHTIKPLDVEAVLGAARTGRVVVAHDHNIVGGLGYYVAAALAEAGVSCKFKMLGCPDRFVPLATTEYLYRVNEYDADGLYEHMRAML